MHSNKKPACAVLLGLAASLILAGCDNEKAAEKAPVEAASADEPALDEAARNEAVAMITGDLNAPLIELHAVLTRAAQDGRIDPEELTIEGATGAIPIDWWLWNKGYLRLSQDEYYGPSLTLSDKGTRFVSGPAPVWLTAKSEGAPRMECQSAGGLTRAVCTANIAYVVSLTPGGDLSRVVVPASSANLEAAFAPGEGWSVTQLSVDGQTPREVARTAIFGTPEMAVEPRRQFFEAIRVQLEQRQATTQEPAPSKADPYVPERHTATAQNPAPIKPAASQAPVVVNARLLRQPTQAEMRSVHPPRALSQNIAGRATMSCTATVEGVLSDCMTQSESPPGQRFGQAAVALAPRYRVSPRTIDGQPVESSVTLNLSWTTD